MGNLRRLLTFLTLFVFFWPMGNPDDPSVPGLLASKNYLFLLALTWAGILIGLVSDGMREGDGILDALVVVFLLMSVFEVLYSLSLGGKILALHLIPMLYSTYFLGRIADGDEVERFLPYVFALGILFVFLTAAYQLVMYAGMQMRFGTRTAFFSPVGITFGTYMFNRERSLWRKGIFLGTVLLSAVVLLLFGNRTAYLSVFVLFLLLLWGSRRARNLRSMLLTIAGIGAVGAGSVLALGSLYVGPVFVLYVLNRFLSLFTRVSRGQDPSLLVRKYDIAGAMERWGWQPFFGRSISDYMLRGLEGSKLLIVDNAYVTFLWKYGAVGLMTFLALLGYSLYVVLDLFRRDTGPLITLLVLLFFDLLVISVSTSVFNAYVHVASLFLLLGIASSRRASLSAV